MYCKLGKGTAALMRWDSLRFYSVWQTLLFEFRFYLCELNALSIYGPCLLREAAKPGRSGHVNRGSSQTAQALGEGKAVEGPVSHHSASRCYPSPKTPTCTLHQTWPLWRQCFWVNLRRIFETKWQYFTDNYTAMENQDFCFIWPSGCHSPPDSFPHCT